jgi:DNA-binding NtrC family response regulator
MAALVLCASDTSLRESWREKLEGRRHEVALASTAASAVERLRLGGIGALLAGLNVLPEVPPMVLISGAPDGPTMSAHAGAAVFIPKPCSLEELAEVVARVATA